MESKIRRTGRGQIKKVLTKNSGNVDMGTHTY